MTRENEERWLERLDLYIDGDLSPEDEQAFLAATETNPQLAARLGEELQLDQSLRGLYRSRPVSRAPARFGRGLPTWTQVAAAVVLLLAGGFAGREWSRSADPRSTTLTEFDTWAGTAQTLGGHASFVASNDSRYEVVQHLNGPALRLEEGELWVRAQSKGIVIETPNGRRLLLHGRGRVTRVETPDIKSLLLVSMQEGEARWLDDPNAEPMRGVAPTMATAFGSEPVARTVSLGQALSDGEDFVVVSEAEYRALRALQDADVAKLVRKIKDLQLKVRELQQEAQSLRAQAQPEDPNEWRASLRDRLREVARAADSRTGRLRQRSTQDLEELVAEMRRAGLSPESVVENTFFGDDADFRDFAVGYRLLGLMGVPVIHWPEWETNLDSVDPKVRETAIVTAAVSRRWQTALPRIRQRWKVERNPHVRLGLAVALIRMQRHDMEAWQLIEDNTELLGRHRGLVLILLRSLFHGRPFPTAVDRHLVALISSEDLPEDMQLMMLRRLAVGPRAQLKDMERRRAFLQAVIDGEPRTRVLRSARLTLKDPQRQIPGRGRGRGRGR